MPAKRTNKCYRVKPHGEDETWFAANKRRQRKRKQMAKVSKRKNRS